MDPSDVLGDFRAVDAERRSFITTLETAQKRRNELCPRIGALKQAEKKGSLSAEQQAELASLSEEVGKQKIIIEEFEQRVAQADEKFKAVLQGVPISRTSQFRLAKAPRTMWITLMGQRSRFDFAAKPHWELGKAFGVLDMGRGAKLAARFTVYWDLGAKLERALANSASRCAYQRAWLYRSSATIPGELGIAVRHGPASQVCCGPVSVPHGDKDLWLIPTEKFRSQTFTVTKRLRAPGCRSRSPPTRPVFEAKRAVWQGCSGMRSGKTSSRRWSW